MHKLLYEIDDLKTAIIRYTRLANRAKTRTGRIAFVSIAAERTIRRKQLSNDFIRLYACYI